MLHSPGPALRPLVTNTAIFILGDTAVVLRVVVGDGGVATDTGVVTVCTNVPTYIVIVFIGTLHVVVTDNLTLVIGSIGGTVLRTLVITCL